MDIKKDEVVIDTSPVDSVGGAQPEPEERPLQRVLHTDVSIKGHLGIPLPKEASGVIPGKITAQMTVGDFAQRMTPCETCKHFDKKKWAELLARWSRSTDIYEQHELNTIRAMYMNSNDPQVIERSQSLEGDIDPNHALSQCGVCTAYTRHFGEMGMSPNEALTVVHPLAVCPSAMPDGTPLPKFYSPKDKRVLSRIKDNLMDMARGRIITK